MLWVHARAADPSLPLGCQGLQAARGVLFIPLVVAGHLVDALPALLTTRKIIRIEIGLFKTCLGRKTMQGVSRGCLT
jgi:hypothetical protein